jgi:rhodanese-related sulfurtransferase
VKFVTENIFLIVIAFVSGAMLLWPMINRQLAGAMVNTLQATRLINDGALVLDVRTPAEWSAGKPVVVVCASGSRAGRAAAALRRAGRADVFCLDGGLSGWQQAGLPVVKKS